MIKILFSILILGCFVADILSQRGGVFEFHDSHGRCWRCVPGSSCVRCPAKIGRNPRSFPDPWDRTCQKPTGALCTQWPGARFPSRCMDHFYQCGENGQSLRVPCANPDMVFDMRQQECVKSDEISSIGCDNYIEGPCPPDEETTTTTLEPITSTSTTSSPLEITTTTTKDPVITTTTSYTPPGVTTTTSYSPTVTSTSTYSLTTTSLTPTISPSVGPITQTTTPSGGPTAGPVTNPPCVCVVWWPCPCNPCWRMPCHSCSGCVGMMG